MTRIALIIGIFVTTGAIAGPQIRLDRPASFEDLETFPGVKILSRGQLKDEHGPFQLNAEAADYLKVQIGDPILCGIYWDEVAAMPL